MTFRELADSRAAAIVSRLGDTATYTHTSGGSVSVEAVFDEGVEVVAENGQIVERVRALSVRKSVLLARVKVGDSVTVMGTLYRVQRVLADDGVVVQVALA